jgi:hypothetical protein
MQPCAKLETDGIVDMNELVRMFECNGASDVRVSVTTGSASEGVQRHFLIEFEDTADPDRRRRYAAGFYAFPCDRHEDGWTRLVFGADDRAVEILSEIGNEIGGNLFDQRVGSRTAFERVYGMVGSISI